MEQSKNIKMPAISSAAKKAVRPFSVCMVFVSTIIGVGFASGKELYEFFARFGRWGYFGIALCSVLFFVTCYAFLYAGKSGCGDSISGLNKLLFPKKAQIFANIFLCFSHLAIISAMLAGVRSLFVMIGLNSWSLYASFVVAAVVFFVSLFSPYKIIKICGLLTPLIVVVMLITSVLTICSEDCNYTVVQGASTASPAIMAILSAVLYAGMNLQTASPLMTPAGKFLSKKQRTYVSLASSIILTICLLLAVIALQFSPDYILSADMPMLELSARFGKPYFLIYVGVLVLGISSTLLSSVFALSDIALPVFKNKMLAILLTVCLGYGMSLLGFSSIVKIVYPVVGVFGVVYIIALFRYIFIRKNDHM